MFTTTASLEVTTPWDPPSTTGLPRGTPGDLPVRLDDLSSRADHGTDLLGRQLAGDLVPAMATTHGTKPVELVEEFEVKVRG